MKKILLILCPLIILLIALRPGKGHTVTGTVTGDQGITLSAVSITLKGTQVATVSGTDGTYRIEIPGKYGILIFSAVGYQTQEIAVKGRSKIDVTLKSTSIAEQEVVVTGYAKKREEYKSKDASAPMAGLIHDRAAGIHTQGQNHIYSNHDHPDFNTEDYDHIAENRFFKTTENPLSTFSIDVDAASYSNVRRYLNLGQLPPAGAVRIEEMINYFRYDYAQPANGHPFAIHTEISDAPWNSKHKLVLIGLQGKKIPTENLPPSNLVFLIDVSGSMGTPNKLPLVKASMKLLVDQLREQDRVSIVVYAGAAGLVLKPTTGNEKTKIKTAIDNLESGGSTAGGAGIKLAYKTAREYFEKEGNNRVILCTDGDFNVGESSDDAMERLIEEERKSGVFLTVLGYGMGNYKDNKMQKLADKGNGNHAYIDGMSEAKKVLVNEFGGTLFTIAKDVKLQVEFNPALVEGYRLIGYENRMLAKEDFNDDKKDAGELGSGHTVTALYEIIPAGTNSEWLRTVDSLKYQSNKTQSAAQSSHSGEILTVKFRYKAPDGYVSKLIVHPLMDKRTVFEKSSDNFRFAASVAEFGMLLRNSEFKANATFENVIRTARNAKGRDEEGYRTEFIKLVENAKSLAGVNPAETESEIIGRR